ncbi:MAG: copper chaperone PCu(A)C [Acidimicrobiales bacterium]|nr:copper chaperone PCu(A)C [Acidimicrobiales bacterium]
MKRLAVLCCALAACGSSGDGDLVVRDPWFRAPPPFANTAAMYAEINNPTDVDDSLLTMGSPQCRSFELHRTVTSDNVASMEAIGDVGLQIGAGESLALEPGGLHGMCLGLDDGFEEGDNVVVDLQFETMGRVTLSVPIQRR